MKLIVLAIEALSEFVYAVGDVLSSVFVGVRYPNIVYPKLKLPPTSNLSYDPRKEYVITDISNACKRLVDFSNIVVYENTNESKLCEEPWTFSWQDGTNSSSKSWTGTWSDGARQ